MAQKYTIADAAAKIINNAGGIVAEGSAIEGGYFVTQSIEVTATGEEGKIPAYACVPGALCYCKEDSKFYQYDGEKKLWVESAINQMNQLEGITDSLAFTQGIDKVATVAVGGIAAGTDLTEKGIAQILEGILFPYVPFTFNGITATDSAGAATDFAGTYEYGQTVTINSITPSFTAGSKPIISVKIGTNVGADGHVVEPFLGSAGSVASETAIRLDNAAVFEGNRGGTIYCTLSDGTTTLTEKVTIKYAYYTYYAVTNTLDNPASWSPVGSTSVSDIQIESNAGQYVWIASADSYDGICELNNLGGFYNSVAATTKISSQTLTNSNGHKCTNIYTFYHLGSPRTGTGTNKFKLA